MARPCIFRGRLCRVVALITFECRRGGRGLLSCCLFRSQDLISGWRKDERAGRIGQIVCHTGLNRVQGIVPIINAVPIHLVNEDVKVDQRIARVGVDNHVVKTIDGIVDIVLEGTNNRQLATKSTTSTSFSPT